MGQVIQNVLYLRWRETIDNKQNELSVYKRIIVLNYWQLILHFVVSSQTISGKSTLESIKWIKYRPLIRKVSIYTGRHWYLALWELTELCNACFYLNVCVCGHALSCPSLCNPTDYRPPGSSVHGVSQARILEWVPIHTFRASSWPKDQTHISCVSCTGRGVLHCTTWEAK